MARNLKNCSLIKNVKQAGDNTPEVQNGKCFGYTQKNFSDNDSDEICDTCRSCNLYIKLHDDDFSNVKHFTKLFKSKKRFSALLDTITKINELNKPDNEKLDMINEILKVASNSLCSICIFDNEEENPVYSKGLCKKHYHEKESYTKLKGRKVIKQNLPAPKSKRVYDPICTIPGCPEKHFSRGFCSLHYSRVFNSGIDPTDLAAMNQPKKGQ